MWRSIIDPPYARGAFARHLYYTPDQSHMGNLLVFIKSKVFALHVGVRTTSQRTRVDLMLRKVFWPPTTIDDV